jgi:hypothetical protein
MASDWTDELKQQVVKEYEAANPTPETSMDIVKELAETHDKTANGVRMILTKAEVYVKKAAGAPASGAGAGKKESTPRVSKQDSIDALTATIEELGLDLDAGIVDKLTGKAAVYFTNLLKVATEDES